MSIERISGVLANIAQVLTFVVVVFGYFYTVVPVFQKEKISEELALLQLEKDKWDDDLNAYKQEAKKTIEEINDLKETKNKLSISLEAKSKEYALVMKKHGKLQQNSKKLETSLRDAENKFYEDLELQLTDGTPLSIEFEAIINRAIALNLFDFDKQKDIKGALDNYYLSPDRLAEKKLAFLKKEIVSSKNYFTIRTAKKLADKFEAGITEHAQLLQCNKADSTAWKNAFVGSLSLEQIMIDSCVEYHFENQIRKEAWTEKKVSNLKKDKFWKQQEAIYIKSCSGPGSYKFLIEGYFDDRWRYVNKPCEDRIMKLSAIVLGKVNDSGLIPLRDISPPSEMEIKGFISEKIIDMYGKKN